MWGARCDLGQKKGCPAQAPLWEKPSENRSDAKEREWPFKVPGALSKVRAESQSPTELRTVT